MEAALLLLLFVIIEFGLTIWLLAKHMEYLKRVKRLEYKVNKYGMESLTDEEKAEGVCASVVANNDKLSSLIQDATPEDMEQARQVLLALGFGGEDGGTE